jgi:hypothetical protein
LTIVQTALVFVGIPAGFVALVAAIVFGRAELDRDGRYRPGRRWEHRPVWYLPHRMAGHDDEQTGHKAIESGESGESDTVLIEAVGGASGEW